MTEMIARLGPIIDSKLRELGTGFTNIDIGPAIALAVLNAMREPTDAMIEAGRWEADDTADLGVGKEAARNVYKAMIEETLL